MKSLFSVSKCLIIFLFPISNIFGQVNWSIDCSNDACEYSFKSDFTDISTAKSQGWEFTDQDDAEVSRYILVAPDEDAEEYYINNKDVSGRITSIALPVADNEDFQLSAYVDWWHGIENTGFGLIYGWKDWDNYVELSITANGFYQVSIISKGLQFGMSDWTETDNVDTKSLVQLNIVRQGSNMIFAINKRIVFTKQVSALKLGNECGFYVGGKQSVLFDDFKMVKTVNNTSSSPRSNNTDGKQLDKKFIPKL